MKVDKYASIQLVSPLSIEMISNNNVAGRNYGGEGTIDTVDKEGRIVAAIYKEGRIVAAIDKEGSDNKVYPVRLRF